jgi:hypothetical protein
MITWNVTGIYRTYLSTLSHKRLSKKKEDHHGEAVRRAQRNTQTQHKKNFKLAIRVIFY